MLCGLCVCLFVWLLFDVWLVCLLSVMVVPVAVYGRVCVFVCLAVWCCAVCWMFDVMLRCVVLCCLCCVWLFGWLVCVSSLVDVWCL